MKITLLTGQTFDIQEHLDFDILVVRSTQAKRLTLRIDEKKHLPVLTIPPRCSSQKALDFVQRNRDWITNMLSRLPQAQKFYDGETINILDKNYTISHRPKERGGVFFDGDKLIVCGAAEFMHRRICDFLKKLAHDKFLAASKKTAAKIGCIVNCVSIKDTKSRWGSCSSKNNLNYNWRVILAPRYVFNYLVCHEVSHLVHKNHSVFFWNCVKELCPDYEEGRAWLKIKGKDLYRYL